MDGSRYLSLSPGRDYKARFEDSVRSAPASAADHAPADPALEW